MKRFNRRITGDSPLKLDKNFDELDPDKLTVKDFYLMRKVQLVEQHPWTVSIIWNYIETGYRRPNKSYYHCFCSLFYLHNGMIDDYFK